MEALPTTLTDGDLVLRRVDPVDADIILEAVRASITELHQWQPWAALDYDRTTSKTWCCRSWLGWEAGTAYDFVLTQPGDERVLGTVGINQIRDRQANLGYWTRTDATGRGLATRATRLAARFAFEQAGLRRIHLHHDVGNHGSRRVAEKAGFVCEGTQRQVAELNGTFIDATFYCLLGSHEITSP